MMPAAVRHRIRLPDGRSLGFDEHGDPDGAPILYFHGVPSCRLDIGMFADDTLFRRLGARLFAVDRPGCGLSDLQPQRRLRDWPSDIAALADHLGLDTFSILGWSGGGPYALACAAALADRVGAVAVVSGVGPFDDAASTAGMNPTVSRFFRLNRDRPVLGRAMDRLMIYGARRRPATFIANTGSALPPVDRLVLERETVGRAYIEAVIEFGRSGASGAQIDASLIAGPWDIDLTRIATTVQVWHGERDTDAPAAMARRLVAQLPRAHPRFLAEEGHLSLIVNHVVEITAELL